MTLPRRHTSATSATSMSSRSSSGSRGEPALRRMSKPSAIACIMPYSMPLWIILTKWPAPFGPGMQIALLGARVAPRRGRAVAGMPPLPGARAAKMGSSRSTAALSPPIIRQ